MDRALGIIENIITQMMNQCGIVPVVLFLWVIYLCVTGWRREKRYIAVDDRVQRMQDSYYESTLKLTLALEAISEKLRHLNDKARENQ